MNRGFYSVRIHMFTVIRTASYYFTASVPAYDGIVLRRAGTLAELSGAEEVMVWKKHESGPMSYHIWAPEIHYLFGNGIFILREARRKISGRSVHMC